MFKTIIVTSLPCLGEKVFVIQPQSGLQELFRISKYLPFPIRNNPLYSKPMTFVYSFLTRFWEITIVYFKILLCAISN